MVMLCEKEKQMSIAASEKGASSWLSALPLKICAMLSSSRNSEMISAYDINRKFQIHQSTVDVVKKIHFTTFFVCKKEVLCLRDTMCSEIVRQG